MLRSEKQKKLKTETVTDNVEQCQTFIMLCERTNVAGMIVRATVHRNVTNER